jgi:PAS domain S-box-containing protein
MDSDCRIVEFNAAAEALSYYRRADVLGREMPGLLVPGRDRTRFRARVRAFLASGDPGEFGSFRRMSLLRADDTERAVDLTAVKVTAGERPTFWAMVRELAETEALRDQREEFLAIVSHELRTPLTSIISFSELIRGEAGGLSPDGVRFLEIIERNADRMLRLVGDLLMLDRLEAGALPLDLAPVAIGALAAESVGSAAKPDVTVHLDVDDGPPVRGDYRRLMQVLDNLIGNAVKFSPPGSLVRVSARHAAGQWRIDVSDTGIGIPRGEATRLFGPFVRATNAKAAGLPGSGLGLSIVETIVAMHGGRVEVDSVLGEGSTFSVFLPADSPSAGFQPADGKGADA